MKRANPDFQIEVGGKPLTLRISAKALAALQDHWGCTSLNDVGMKLESLDGEETTLQDFTAILWAALRSHHPDITKDDAFDLLDEMGLAGFQAALIEALAGSSASSEGGGGDASENPPKRGRLSAS